jgi:hypothetical protein
MRQLFVVERDLCCPFLFADYRLHAVSLHLPFLRPAIHECIGGKLHASAFHTCSSTVHPQPKMHVCKRCNARLCCSIIHALFNFILSSKVHSRINIKHASLDHVYSSQHYIDSHYKYQHRQSQLWADCCLGWENSCMLQKTSCSRQHQPMRQGMYTWQWLHVLRMLMPQAQSELKCIV